MNYQVVVLGGGPGGYVAAIRAAQCGRTVALIEQQALGGTCLNRGCIPTKALLRSAEIYQTIQTAGAFGIETAPASVNAKAVFARKDAIVNQLVGGVKGLMAANKIKVYYGSGTAVDAHTITVDASDGTQHTITAEKLIIATGSKPFVPPIEGAKLEGVITSDEALGLTHIPAAMTIIGGGVIGLEFAYLLQSFGCSVTVIEMQPELLMMADREVAAALAAALTKAGVQFFTNAKVSRIVKASDGLVVEYQYNGGTYKAVSENVLIATGRAASLAGLEALGFAEQKSIAVNERMETAIADVYAIGDVTGGIQLAHVASAQGIVAAENAAGLSACYQGDNVPSCIYTSPEAAWVGWSEQEAKERGVEVRIGKFPFAASGKALAYGDSAGFVKIVSDARYGEILGVHIVGPHATDLIGEGMLARELEATVTELGHAVHAHPTLSEAMMEAAHVAMGRGIHFGR